MAGSEGEPQVLIPEIDIEYLNGKCYRYNLSQADGFVHAVITDFPLPAAYSPNVANLLIRLPAGYPNANPDMFWTIPDVHLKSGTWPAAAQVHEQYDGQNWQRWSRHIGSGWRPGIDDLQTYLAAIHSELKKGI